MKNFRQSRVSPYHVRGNISALIAQQQQSMQASSQPENQITTPGHSVSMQNSPQNSKATPQVYLRGSVPTVQQQLGGVRQLRLNSQTVRQQNQTPLVTHNYFINQLNIDLTKAKQKLGSKEGAVVSAVSDTALQTPSTEGVQNIAHISPRRLSFARASKKDLSIDVENNVQQQEAAVAVAISQRTDKSFMPQNSNTITPSSTTSTKSNRYSRAARAISNQIAQQNQQQLLLQGQRHPSPYQVYRQRTITQRDSARQKASTPTPAAKTHAAEEQNSAAMQNSSQMNSTISPRVGTLIPSATPSQKLSLLHSERMQLQTLEMHNRNFLLTPRDQRDGRSNSTRRRQVARPRSTSLQRGGQPRRFTAIGSTTNEGLTSQLTLDPPSAEPLIKIASLRTHSIDAGTQHTGTTLPNPAYAKIPASISQMSLVPGQEDSTMQPPEQHLELKYSFRTRKGVLPTNPNKTNQDSYVIFPKVGERPWQHYFSVNDGHGVNGHHVSQCIKQKVQALLSHNMDLENNPRKALYEIFEQLHKHLEKESGIDLSFSGSTSNSVLFHRQSIFCCNIGDSRAVVGKRKNDRWSVIPLSRDHKPTDRDEAQRILQHGGRVDAFRDQEGQAIGPLRVWLQGENIPGLAMTRSLGDQVAASVGVTWKPEIVEYESTSNDKIVVLGSDGLWEFIENKEVIKLLVPYYLRQDLEGACDCLLVEALTRWQRESNVIDDITFTIIFMNY